MLLSPHEINPLEVTEDSLSHHRALLSDTAPKAITPEPRPTWRLRDSRLLPVLIYGGDRPFIHPFRSCS